MDMQLHVRILLIALWCAACGSGGPSDEGFIVENPFHGALQDGPSPISFTLEQSFGAAESPAEDVLAHVMDIAVDTDSRLYVLETDRIMAFGANGEFLWMTGREGEGPGEFARPRSISVSGDRLHVTNQAGTRHDVFTLDGTYLDSRMSTDLGSPNMQIQGALDDGTLVATSALPSAFAVTVHVIEAEDGDPAEWRVVRSFDVDQTGSLEIPGSISVPPDVSVMKNAISVSSVVRYEFSMLSPDGDTLRVVRRTGTSFARPGMVSSGDRPGLVPFSVTYGPLELNDGYTLFMASYPGEAIDPDEVTRQILVSRSRPDHESQTTFDLFSPDGHLIYSLEGEQLEALDLGRPFETGPDGRLYTYRTLPYPRIDRYHVTISE